LTLLNQTYRATNTSTVAASLREIVSREISLAWCHYGTTLLKVKSKHISVNLRSPRRSCRRRNEVHV